MTSLQPCKPPQADNKHNDQYQQQKTIRNHEGSRFSLDGKHHVPFWRRFGKEQINEQHTMNKQHDVGNPKLYNDTQAINKQHEVGNPVHYNVPQANVNQFEAENANQAYLNEQKRGNKLTQFIGHGFPKQHAKEPTSSNDQKPEKIVRITWQIEEYDVVNPAQHNGQKPPYRT